MCRLVSILTVFACVCMCDRHVCDLCTCVIVHMYCLCVHVYGCVYVCVALGTLCTCVYLCEELSPALSLVMVKVITSFFYD